MKAIIPAAGLGTRLLPITKVVPKELMPVGSKPAIQWVLEEAVQAGLREFIVVISPGKTILREYLTPLAESETLAHHPGLVELEHLLRMVHITFVEQPYPEGLGDALLRCRDLIGKQPFALLLPDNICSAESHLLERLLEIHRAYGKSCLALQRTNDASHSSGAFIVRSFHEPVYKVEHVLSKGAPEGQTIGLRGIGRYILEAAAFAYLKRMRTDGESDEVPALEGLANDGRLLGLLVADSVCHLGVN